MIDPPALGVGLIGAGRFGHFVAAAVAELPDELSLRTVTDPAHGSAQQLASRYAARVVDDVDSLLGCEDVEVVVVASPPSSHASLAIRALRAGCHVFCEKPVALTTADAERVSAAVAESGCAYVVDHVLRYNPVIAALVRLRGEGLLGPVQRLAFENDAADEDLPAGHWFWDDAVSGGILLEHAVHFFDAGAELIASSPSCVQATGHVRSDGRTDTVVCTVGHRNGALATYAHGFSHAHRAERQLMRLDFGMAEARIHGWIPLRADIDVWTDRIDDFLWLPQRGAELFRIAGFRPSGQEQIRVEATRHAAPPAARARGVEQTAPHHVTATLSLGDADAKPRVYRESVRTALHDLVSCARTGRPPYADIAAGADAVRVAAAASRALHDGRTYQLTDQEFRCRVTA